MNEHACFSPLAIAVAFLHPDSLSPTCSLLLFEPTAPPYMRAARYVCYFLLTCALEAPIYWPIYWNASRRRPLRARIGQIAILNLATHPAVTWAFPLFFSWIHRPYRDTVFWSETFAWVVEAILLASAYRYTIRRAVCAAFTANLFSWWSGLYVSSWLIGKLLAL